MKEYILRNYTIQFDMYNKPIYAFGQVFNNPKFEDGTFVRTSTIIKFDETNMFLETLNSIYHLEKGE